VVRAIEQHGEARPKYAAKVAYGTEHYSKLLAPNYDVVGQKLGDWTQRWTAIFTS